MYAVNTNYEQSLKLNTAKFKYDDRVTTSIRSEEFQRLDKIYVNVKMKKAEKIFHAFWNCKCLCSYLKTAKYIPLYPT